MALLIFSLVSPLFRAVPLPPVSSEKLLVKNHTNNKHDTEKAV